MTPKEIFDALFEGKTLKRIISLTPPFYYRINKYLEYSEDLNKWSKSIEDVNSIIEASDKFSIIKPKVKYYPALGKYPYKDIYYLSSVNFKNEDEARLKMKRSFSRLVTEVPELIEERNE